GRRARASAKRPHAAWRGCSRCLRSASTVEGPCPRQQKQGCLRTASPKKEKHRRSLRRTVASVAGSLPALPRAGRQRPARVAGGSGPLPPRPRPEAQRALGEGTTARVAKTPARPVAAPTDKTLSCSCPAQKRKNFVSRARTTSLRSVVLSAQKLQKEPNCDVPGGPSCMWQPPVCRLPD